MISNARDNQNDEENFLTKLLHLYVPYWPMFILLLLLFGAGAVLYLRYATRIYETSATILVKDEKKGVDESNMMEQLNLFSSKKLVENEIEVIQSRTLMRRVVDSLALYAPITREGKIKSGSAYRSSPIVVEVKSPDSLTPCKKAYFIYDSAQSLVLLNGHQYPLNTWVNDSLGELRFKPNPNYIAIQKATPLYFSLINVKSVIDGLLEGLKIAQATKLSSVIVLQMKDAAPKRAEDILNHLIYEYNNAALSDKNALASNTLKFVNDRLKLVSHELDSVEIGIEKYKTKEGIVDISAQGAQYLENAGMNDQKLSEVSVQLAVMDEVEKYVRSKSGQSGIVPSTFGLTDPVLAQLLEKLYNLEVQYEGLSKTTAENNPILISVKNEIDKIKPSILENVQSQRRNLRAGLGNLSSTSDKYNSMLYSLPKKERKLVEISRQREIKNSINTFLLQKREETALSYNSSIADMRIIDQAETKVKPVAPRTTVILLIAILAAFGAGAAIVSIKEVFNRNIVFRSEIEKYTSIPIIGEIMRETTDGQLVIQEGRRSVIAEQFRQLRTSLAFIGINSRKKKILVTSSVGSEGKSFITANLGVSLALTDKKVVLLELDLRKPKLSKLLGVQSGVGITNYFVGNKEPDEIIRKTAVSPNLFVIPAGAIPPNPSELILNGRLDELLSYLDKIFDYIIIDTAPVSPVTDAYILSPFCDATIYVIRHDYTPKNFIKKLDSNLKVRGLKNIAIVFNDVKNRGVLNYSGNAYGYAYGNENNSGYGYKYSEETEKTNILSRIFKRKKTLS
jgi:tyrosine-protein kinase Etk/Wzc